MHQLPILAASCCTSYILTDCPEANASTFSATGFHRTSSTGLSPIYSVVNGLQTGSAEASIGRCQIFA